MLAALVALVTYALYRAISYAWVCDDAFISFRYARNLVDGHGLVFNEGERVEGYSNFLWTMLVALGMRWGADPVLLSQGLGIVAYGLLLVLLARHSWLVSRVAGGPHGYWPVAAIALALHHHAQVFATSGLETMMFALLTTAGLLGLGRADRPSRFGLAGMALTAAAMTRPDGVLVYVVAAAVAGVELALRRRPRDLAALVLPGLLLYVPYFVWRWSYYGWLFPNTYYAKSANLPNWEQGGHYASLYFSAYWVLALAPVAVAAVAYRAWRERRSAAGDGRWAVAGAPPRHRLVLLAALTSAIYVAWVVRVGGDFMFARFFIAPTAWLLLLLDGATALARGVAARGIASGAVALGTALWWPPQGLDELRSGVVEERTFYPPERLEQARSAGERLASELAGEDVRVVIYGSQAMLAYYAGLRTVIEGHGGLTDETIAHQPLELRSRAGHEKRASHAYLVERGVHFTFSFGLWKLPSRGGFDEIEIGGLRGRIITYDPGLMGRLRGRAGVRFTPIDELLERVLRELPTMPCNRARSSYARLRDYYFARVPGSRAERELVGLLDDPKRCAPTGR